MGRDPGLIDTLLANPNVTPLASKNGGFLFLKIDSEGRTFELHTLFTPDGWGREVAVAAREAFRRIFAAGAQVIVTMEVSGWWRSAPPRSHGWVPAGDFAPMAATGDDARSWVLTKTAWLDSPVFKRMTKCPL